MAEFWFENPNFNSFFLVYTEDERTFIYILSNVAKGQEEEQT